MNKQKREELKRKIAAQSNGSPVVSTASGPTQTTAGDRSVILPTHNGVPFETEASQEADRKRLENRKPIPLASVTHTCGHKTGIAQLESIACAGCIEANKRKRWERKKAAQAKRSETLQVQVDSFRLPDGATYYKSYSAETKTWSASLLVNVNGKPRQFTASGSASFKVEIELDRMYREAVKEANRAAEIAEAKMDIEEAKIAKA